jgi:flagellar hook-length control protein FliK
VAGSETSPRRGDSPVRAAVAVATPVAMPVAALSPDSARALSRLESGASTADIQALLPSVAQVAAAASAASTVAMPAGNPVSAPAQTWIQTPVTQPGFSNEVVVALVRDVSQAEQGTHALTLHLNPEELGPVSVSIEMQGSTARIEFSASEALTRQHLESALPELHQALQDHGVSLTQSGVHEASKESLAASAAGSQMSGGAGSDARQRGDAPFDGRSGYGERAPRWETEVFSVDGSAMADSNARAQASRGPSPGRAGRLDLFA